MLNEKRALDELSSLYESVNKKQNLETKVNFILENNSFSFYNKNTLKECVKQIVYNEQATEVDKGICLDLFIKEIQNNTLTEARSEEILNEFIGKLGNFVKDKWDAVKSAGQTVGSAFNRTGTGVVSSPAQSFANRLQRIANAVNALQAEINAPAPGNITISQWWESIKADPAGSQTTGHNAARMPSGEFFKLLGADPRSADPRVQQFINAISVTLPSLMLDSKNPFVGIEKELQVMVQNRRTPQPQATQAQAVQPQQKPKRARKAAAATAPSTP